MFGVAIPILLFRTLGTFDWPPISPLPIWAAYFGGAAVTWAMAMLLARRGFRCGAREAVIAGISSGYPNIVLIGVPLFATALGDEGLVVGFLLISIHLPVMMVASVVLIARAERRDGVAAGSPALAAELARMGARLVRNPLIVAIAAGLAFRLTGLELSGIPRQVIDEMSAVAIPLALFSLGMGLWKYGLGGSLAPAAALSVLKLVAMPALVYLFATRLAGLPLVATQVVTLAAALPTGINAYLIANRFETGHGLASNAITLTTAVSILTLTLWLGFLGL